MIVTKLLQFYAFQALLIKHCWGPPFLIQSAIHTWKWYRCIGTLSWRAHPKNGASASMDLRRVRKHSLTLREMQDAQEYAQTQISEERKQRDSQAKKRYNCYKKNIVIVWREILFISWGDMTQTFRSDYEKEEARWPGEAAKHCCTEKRQQEAQAMAAKCRSESLQSTRSAVSTQTFVALVYSCSCIWGTQCSSYSCLHSMRTHSYPLLAYDVQAL